MSCTTTSPIIVSTSPRVVDSERVGDLLHLNAPVAQPERMAQAVPSLLAVFERELKSERMPCPICSAPRGENSIAPKSARTPTSAIPRPWRFVDRAEHPLVWRELDPARSTSPDPPLGNDCNWQELVSRLPKMQCSQPTLVRASSEPGPATATRGDHSNWLNRNPRLQKAQDCPPPLMRARSDPGRSPEQLRGLTQFQVYKPVLFV